MNSPTAIEPFFAGEVQLAGCGWTHNNGAKVTFFLADDEQLNAFKDLTARKGNKAGHRFMMVMVEIGDDELPVQPEPVAPKKESTAILTPMMLACRLCADSEFQAWTHSQNADEAKQYILTRCKISSRKELDHSREAQQLFEDFVRIPFLQWQGKR